MGDEKAGFAAYRLEGDAYAFTHTEIDDAVRGQGPRLAAGRRGAGRSCATGASAVLPYCPFVKAYLQRHRELVDLVPEAERARFGL